MGSRRQRGKSRFTHLWTWCAELFTMTPLRNKHLERSIITFMRFDNLPDALLLAGGATDHLDGYTIAKNFLNKWEGYTLDHLQRVLQTNDIEHQQDRIFALFALGYLVETKAVDVIIPFLASSRRRERWASIISLGRLRCEAAFSPLQDLLLENLLNRQMTEDVDSFIDTDWCDGHRSDIAFLLGDWGKTTAVPTLRVAFLLTIDKIIQQEENTWEIDTLWQSFQWSLAYALGQLGAWGALSIPQLPLAQWQMASLFLILGSLQSSNKDLLQYRERLTSGLSYPLVKRRDGKLATAFVHLDQITRVLQERFGFSPEEQMAYIQQIWQAHPAYEMPSVPWQREPPWNV